ncbi:hypothetical protein HDU98_001834, partial [Podochytrium sp. JEL0797]
MPKLIVATLLALCIQSCLGEDNSSTSTSTLASQVAAMAPQDSVLAIVKNMPSCPQACLANQFQTISGVAGDLAVLTQDAVLSACHDSIVFNAGYDACIQACPSQDQIAASAWHGFFQVICAAAATQDPINIITDIPPPSSEPWSPYYNNTLSNFDWINIREAIKTIVQVKQYGPVFLRLSWHDTATGNILTGIGGPHATMMLQDPEDPQNKGLQRAIDALEPLYAVYAANISRADLWSYAGAVAVRTMGGPNTKWRPGRQDYTSLDQANLTSPANDIPKALDNWPTILAKFQSMGLNITDMAALLHGGH